MKITVRLVGMLFLIAGCISCKTTRLVPVSESVTYRTEEGERITIRIPDTFRRVSSQAIDSIFTSAEWDRSWIRPPVDLFYADSIAIFIRCGYLRSSCAIGYSEWKESLYPSVGSEGFEIRQRDYSWICPHIGFSYYNRSLNQPYYQEAYLLLEKAYVLVIIYTFHFPQAPKRSKKLLKELIRQMEIDPGNAHPRSYKPDRKEETPQSRVWKQYKKRHR